MNDHDQLCRVLAETMRQLDETRAAAEALAEALREHIPAIDKLIRASWDKMELVRDAAIALDIIERKLTQWKEAKK